MNNTCVYSDIEPFNEPELQCSRTSFIRGAHGFLCKDHLVALETSRPPKPRKPRETWVWSFSCPDERVIQHIVETDKRLICEGKVTSLRFRDDDGVVRAFKTLN